MRSVKDLRERVNGAEVSAVFGVFSDACPWIGLSDARFCGTLRSIEDGRQKGARRYHLVQPWRERATPRVVLSSA
jgi:hypothetical protein